MKNPKWARDELILALELYFRVNPISTSDEHPDIQKLSDTLNSMPIHPKNVHGDKFRNPNGVYMKLCNFLRFDPNYKGTGLSRGGKLEEVVWKEFSDDHSRLKAVADLIRSSISKIPPPGDSEEAAIDEEEEFVDLTSARSMEIWVKDLRNVTTGYLYPRCHNLKRPNYLI